MAFINNNIKWIMIVSGVITCSLLLTLVSPAAGLTNLFGESIELQAMTQIIVRNWAALITVTGALLIYGAFNPQYRRLVMVIASISKTIFITLVLIYGSQFMDTAITAVVFDAVVILLFLSYLFTAKE
ncbi:MAG: hypothetical protein AAF431_19410 [Pseudomonadota bacterium]